MSYELKYLKYKNKYLKLKEYLGGTQDESTILIIPDSVENIDEHQYSKKGLTKLTIGKSVKTIGNAAFSRNQLTTLIIPNSVKTIGRSAFSQNPLTTLTIGNSVETIGIAAFSGNKLTTLTIPNSVKMIGEFAFSENQLTTLIIPNSVKTIDYKAFYRNQLTTLTIPNSVKTIGKSAFSYNQLTELTIPNSVETIGGLAFFDNKLTTLIIPNSVKTIGESAFSYNQLTELTIPNSVETIGNEAFEYNQLTNLIIPDSIKEISRSAFYRNQLTTLIIGNSVKTIGRSAFYRNQLTTLIIPNSVEMIGESAFSQNQLTTLIIPNSVKIINQAAFYRNPLTEIITYNREFNDLDKIHLITDINKEKIIIDTESQIAPYTIRIKENLYIPYITGNGLSIDIKYTIENDKRINNFIDQLYTNTEFKQLIDNCENISLFVTLTKIITKSNGHTEEIRDPAIDAGGVTSFIFNNLFDDLTKESNPYFKSIDNYYILNDRIFVGKTSEEKTELKKKIEFIGRLFAYALQLEQTIDIDLHPLLLYKMLFGIDALIDENHIDYLIKNFDLDTSEYPFGCFIEPVAKACKYDSDSDDGLELTDIEIIKKNAIELIKTSESYNNEILNSFVTGFRTKIVFNDKKYKSITLVSELSELISGKNKMWSFNELMENLEFDSGDTSSTSSKDNFFTIIKSVITDELIKEGELIKGQSITEAMCNQIENETIKLWISLFIQLLTNRKKIPVDEFKDKKLTISVINLPSLIDRPYIVHTCSHTMDIYVNDIKKLKESLLYNYLSIDHMKVQVTDLGLA